MNRPFSVLVVRAGEDARARLVAEERFAAAARRAGVTVEQTTVAGGRPLFDREEPAGRAAIARALSFFTEALAKRE